MLSFFAVNGANSYKYYGTFIPECVIILNSTKQNSLNGEISMIKRFLAGALMAAVFAGMQTIPLQYVQAAQVRQDEAGRLLEAATEELEKGSYAEGEAIVSLEAAGTVALAREGVYRFDSDVQVEEVNEFGVDEQTGKEKYIVHLTSEKYTAEELMRLALEQYYVDGVGANQYRQLFAADPYRSAQWYLDGSGADSKGIRLAKQQVTCKKTPVIAVIDTGVNYNHPDLADNMWDNPYPDILPGVCGYDFGDDDADPMDQNGHGTHVAGIAAAKSKNGIGIAGVSDAEIMALKVVSKDADKITDTAIISAYDYIYDAMTAGVNVKAVNCSWGGNHDQNGVLSKAVNAVGRLGALSVFAAGNDHVNWDQVRTALVTPYDLDSSYVVIVGASDEQDEAAYFSDYGADYVDLFAPGSNMLSTGVEPLYLPGIYTAGERQNNSVYFNRFENTTANILPQGQTWKNYYTAQELGIATEYTVDIESVKNGGNGYVKLDITRSRASQSGESEAAGSIYVDVTDLQLDQNATYYVSFLEGTRSGSKISWQAANMVSKTGASRFVTSGGRTYMRIVGLEIAPKAAGQKMYLYLDDIGISTANPNPETFGAYTYMSGSSMAAPVVSASIATLGAANPTISGKELRSLLLKCVRKVSGLSGKCKTGGVIDASKFITRATKLTLNKKSATLRYGKTLTLKAKVSPSYAVGTKVTWKSGNTKYATVNSKGVVRVKKAGIGHTVKITATASDGSGKKAVCRIKLIK